MSVEIKTCTKCGELKPAIEFRRDKKAKGGLRAQCKTCDAEYQREYREANPEKTAEYLREYRKANREKLAGYNREWYKANLERAAKCSREHYKANREKVAERTRKWRRANPEKAAEHSRKYREANREKIAERKRRYRETNCEKVAEYNREYRRNRKAEDIQFKLVCNLRNRLYHAVKGNFKNGSAVRDLGCTIEELKEYLEAKFEPGMTWENWGRGGGKDVWNIDHVRPLSSFDLTDRKQLKKVCHYTNLQPLWAEDNMRKGDKMPGGNFD